ncbi:hypothetical protein [Arthrobacter woluwensis]|uniref:Uncharacterized protein n=1 Tax=Arthrobacter woluwensis TaxID=156980 RepID=A0A1H4R8K4_9MICC|nr:hypothetical protein [Arthrobacter woluwensis]SEC28229.1 hypothetical protein SAMN04489745_2490 [Arthrobacter woluwensis]
MGTEHEEVGDVDGVPLRVPVDDGYRTCAACGGDCEPGVEFGSNEHKARVAFVCPEHGPQSLIDPFEDLR